jgi:hypothetical protein
MLAGSGVKWRRRGASRALGGEPRALDMCAPSSRRSTTTQRDGASGRRELDLCLRKCYTHMWAHPCRAASSADRWLQIGLGAGETGEGDEYDKWIHVVTESRKLCRPWLVLTRSAKQV